MLNNWYSEPNIVSCTFIGNSAGWGGGIRNYEYSSSRMTNCDISENTAGYGGGLACGSNDRLTNCTISGNSATYGGGMLCAGLTSPTLDGCVISGNYASGFGGGMHNWWHSAPNLKNCTISGNSAGWGGGGVCNYEGNSILTNCTISGNYGYYGGGIYEHDVWSYIDTVVANCILWGNEAVYGPQINRKNSYAYFLLSYSDVQGGQAGIHIDSSRPVERLSGNMDADPCFVEAGYWVDACDVNIVVEPNDPNAVWVEGDYHLLQTSPCIDTGDPNFIPEPNEKDLDGNPRVVDGDNDGNSVVDMGAYEVQLLEPDELIAQLLEEIGELELPSGIENSLMAKLEAALGAMEDENENNDAAAINTLGAFINALEAQSGKKISEADADALIAVAQQIIDILSGE
jgi:hypothetical protein